MRRIISIRWSSYKGEGQLLYEAGEALRFDEKSIRIGIRGVLNVMRYIGVLPKRKSKTIRISPSISKSSSWLRAPSGGLFRAYKGLGDHVNTDDILGMVSGPLGESEQEIIAKDEGIIIGRNNLPVVNLGDALFHVAQVESLQRLEKTTDNLDLAIEQETTQNEEEII